MESLKDVEDLYSKRDIKRTLELSERLKSQEVNLIARIRTPSPIVSFCTQDTSDKKGLIIIGCEDGSIRSYDVEGNFRWKKRLKNEVSCIYIRDDILFISSKTDLYLVNPLSGDQLSAKRLQREITSIYATSINLHYVKSLSKKGIRLLKDEGMSNEIFIGLREGGVMCIDNIHFPKSKQEERDIFNNQVKIKERVLSISADDINNDGHNEVIVGTEDSLYILSYKGEELWRFQTNGKVIRLSIEDIDGDLNKEIIAGDDSGYIYLLEPKRCRSLIPIGGEIKGIKIHKEQGRKMILTATDFDIIILDSWGEEKERIDYQNTKDISLLGGSLVICKKDMVSIYDYTMTRIIEDYIRKCKEELGYLEKKRRLKDIQNPYPAPEGIYIDYSKDREEAEKRLEVPIYGILEFSKETKEGILRLADYRPSFCQLIGFYIFEELKNKRPDEIVFSKKMVWVSESDVYNPDIVKKLLKFFENRFMLSNNEKLLAAALAQGKFSLFSYLIDDKERKDTINLLIHKGIFHLKEGRLKFAVPLFAKIFQMEFLHKLANEVFISKPLSLLYKTDEYLKKKGVLAQILKDIQITEEEWNIAIGLSVIWEKMEERNRLIEGKIDEFIALFCKLLGFEIKDKKEKTNLFFYELNMPETFIRTLGNTYILVCKTSSFQDVKSLFNTTKEMVNFAQGENLFFVLARGETKKIKKLAKESLINIVILDEDETRKIIFSFSRNNEFTRAILRQYGISVISPYETQSPVSERMFYGRKRETMLLVSKQDTNFAIIGGRKIGKTSLMKRALDVLKKEGISIPIYLDCSIIEDTQSFVATVVERLVGRGKTKLSIHQFPSFLRIISEKYRKKITFFLDEIDSLLYYDRLRANIWLKTLRVSFQEGYCRYIVSGFRELFSEQKRLDSPLFNFMQPIRISVLDEESAKNLIVEPMSGLGVTFVDKKRIAEEILYQAGCHPNIIQFHCSRLIKLLDEKERFELCLKDVEEVKNSLEFEDFIAGTFLEIADSLEKLIIFLVLETNEKITDEFIDRRLKEKGIFLDFSELKRKMDDLEIANILIKEDVYYQFSYPKFPEILRKRYDINFILEKILEEVK
ncbi:TPA: hypothetical protein DCX16_06570 [bacterium]|nr:hypothetical protein [bacterium]